MGVPSYCASFSNEGMVERLDQPVRTKKVMRPELVQLVEMDRRFLLRSG